MRKFIQSVIVAVIENNGKYLLTYRVNKKYRKYESEFNNVWQFPGGGLEFGESTEEGLRREILEELGAEVEIIKLIPKTFFTVKNQWHGLIIAYLCRLKDQSKQIKLNHEASKYKWFTLKEVQSLRTLPNDKAIAIEVEKMLKE